MEYPAAARWRERESGHPGPRPQLQLDLNKRKIFNMCTHIYKSRHNSNLTLVAHTHDFLIPLYLIGLAGTSLGPAHKACKLWGTRVFPACLPSGYTSGVLGEAIPYPNWVGMDQVDPAWYHIYVLDGKTTPSLLRRGRGGRWENCWYYPLLSCWLHVDSNCACSRN